MGELLHSCQREQKFEQPSWAINATLYEMNVRQFTNEGTFKAAELHLPRLAKLGVSILWLMPIFTIGYERRKGSLGSYYSTQNYTKVNPEFGTETDFKSFVKTAHSLGIKVILDWVANHTARDAEWTKTNPDWYEWDNDKNEIATPFDWSDTAKLNYNSKEMREAMIKALEYWVEKCAIDGYRMDMAMLVPIDFWDEALTRIKVKNDDTFFLAEAEGPEFHKAGFHATYGWATHHLLNDIAKGHASANDLANMMKNDAICYNSNSMRMQFTSNHDENSWNGTEFARMGQAAEQMAALTFVLDGMPLIYSGQEVGMNRQLEFFDKDEIIWTPDTHFEKLYTELSELKKTNPVLGAARKGADVVRIDTSDRHNIFAVKRIIDGTGVIALFNFSGHNVDFNVYDNEFSGEFKQVLGDNTAILNDGQHFFLPAWGWFIYHN